MHYVQVPLENALEQPLVVSLSKLQELVFVKGSVNRR